MSSNFYWLSTKKPKLDWETTTPLSTTPITSYEDMTELSNLSKAHLTATARLRPGEGRKLCPSQRQEHIGRIGIPVRLAVEAGNPGEEILPVLWKIVYLSPIAWGGTHC